MRRSEALEIARRALSYDITHLTTVKNFCAMNPVQAKTLRRLTTADSVLEEMLDEERDLEEWSEMVDAQEQSG